jgi:hypothetical protein
MDQDDSDDHGFAIIERYERDVLRRPANRPRGFVCDDGRMRAAIELFRSIDRCHRPA